jgi:hypothetical protein
VHDVAGRNHAVVDDQKPFGSQCPRDAFKRLVGKFDADAPPDRRGR